MSKEKSKPAKMQCRWFVFCFYYDISDIFGNDIVVLMSLSNFENCIMVS